MAPIKSYGQKGVKVYRTASAEAASLLLALLFAYTAFSKVYDWYGTRNALYNQVFPGWTAELLLYGLPLVEILVAVMLLIPRHRRTALLGSVLLMAVFTVYVGLVMTGIFGRVPCSCGGVIGSLGWGEHLVFNLVFLGIAIWGRVNN